MSKGLLDHVEQRGDLKGMEKGVEIGRRWALLALRVRVGPYPGEGSGLASATSHGPLATDNGPP